MHIAIDVSPLTSRHNLAHRVRGTGMYIEGLRSALETYFPNHSYLYFNRGDTLPSDVDIVHYPYFEPFFLTMPLALRYKTVVTVHDLTPLVFPQFFPSGLKGRAKWQVQKHLLKKTHAIITDSMASKKDIIRFAGVAEENVNVVYLAASDEFKPIKDAKQHTLIRKKYNLPQNFVLYVGDVTWNKNLPRLIRAVEKLNLSLVLVGKAVAEAEFDRANPWNQDRITVEKLAQKNQSIIRLGFLPLSDLVTLYSMARVFAMPSLYEGFGLPVLEAMQCGTAVVVSKRGSLPEVVGKAGCYVDAEDENSIVSGIQEVITNHDLQKKLQQDSLNQSKRFTWKETAINTMLVYEKVLGQ